MSFVHEGTAPATEPDAFYLGVLRDGSVALAFDMKHFRPEPDKKAPAGKIIPKGERQEN